MKQQHQNSTCEMFIFIICYLGFLVLSFKSIFNLCFLYLSCVCVGEHECLHLSKKTISRTPIFVLHFVKHSRFYLDPFCRQNLVDVQKTL